MSVQNFVLQSFKILLEWNWPYSWHIQISQISSICADCNNSFFSSMLLFWATWSNLPVVASECYVYCLAGQFEYFCRSYSLEKKFLSGKKWMTAAAISTKTSQKNKKSAAANYSNLHFECGLVLATSHTQAHTVCWNSTKPKMHAVSR